MELPSGKDSNPISTRVRDACQSLLGGSNCEFDMTQAYLFSAQPLTPLARTLAVTKAPLVLLEQTKHDRGKTPLAQRDCRVALASVADAMSPLNRRSSVTLGGFQKGNRE